MLFGSPPPHPPPSIVTSSGAQFCTERQTDPRKLNKMELPAATSFTFSDPQHLAPTRSITAATPIWIEPISRADGRKHYTSERGLLLMARLGGPNGMILVEGVHNPVCESCRVLMSRGIVGPFETWKQGVPYPCLRGEIEKMAGLTVNEPDKGVVHFAKWTPFDQNAVSRSAVQPPASEEDAAVRRTAAGAIAGPSAGGEQSAEAAESEL